MALHDRMVVQAGAAGIRTELNAAKVYADYSDSAIVCYDRKASCLPKRNWSTREARWNVCFVTRESA